MVASLPEHLLQSGDYRNQGHRLTPRQVEVLSLVCQGKTNPQIARALNLEVGTVAIHLARIYAKLRCRNRVQATLAALRLGICQAEP